MLNSNLEKLYGIQTLAHGPYHEDRGGYYSKDLNVWVENDLEKLTEGSNFNTLSLLEAFAGIALCIGKIHKQQLKEIQSNIIWPSSLYDKTGEALINAISINPNISDPFCVVNKDLSITPFSKQYKDMFLNFLETADKILENDSQAAQDIKPYIKQLKKAYIFEEERDSDLEYMRNANKAWVNIPESAEFLIFAEPTEVYQDSLRVELEKNVQITGWAKEVEHKQGLVPWKNFFEFRLMKKNESMIAKNEMNSIRNTTRELFNAGNTTEVPVSLEFRHLLWAAGQGAYPAKTAKNYPNFSDIRKNIGYKNVLYTNMIENATETETLPQLLKYFDIGWLKTPEANKRITRGRLILIVAHEENHPYIRMSNSVLEETKATINGFKAIISSGSFDKNDIEATMLGLIGGMLATKEKTFEARNNNDKNAQNAMEAYYKQDIIISNFLYQKGVFASNSTGMITGLNTAKIADTINELSDKFMQIYRNEMRIDAIFDQYSNDNIWAKFEAHI